MASKAEGRSVAAIVAALLLPPLGIFLDQGINANFWIALILTCLAFIPGVLFALFTVLRPRLGTTA
jgi:uncharacterized membrane protein YqaE (UPF0057 family)